MSTELSSIGGDLTNPNNETTAIPSEAGWSWSELPAIIGRLDPPTSRQGLTGPVPSLQENGRVVFDTGTKSKPIRDFPFLPRYLSSNLEDFRIEAYMREDPRLSYRDLWARMPVGTPEFDYARVRNLSNQRHRHVRKPNKALCWDTKGPPGARVMVELVELLLPVQIDLNTTWDVCAEGISQPGSTRILPHDTFLEVGETIHTPSQAMHDARVKLQELQTLAASLGLGGWKDLPTSRLPDTWQMRVKKEKDEKPEIEAGTTKRSTVAQNLVVDIPQAKVRACGAGYQRSLGGSERTKVLGTKPRKQSAARVTRPTAPSTTQTINSTFSRTSIMELDLLNLPPLQPATRRANQRVPPPEPQPSGRSYLASMSRTIADKQPMETENFRGHLLLNSSGPSKAATDMIGAATMRKTSDYSSLTPVTQPAKGQEEEGTSRPFDDLYDATPTRKGASGRPILAATEPDFDDLFDATPPRKGTSSRVDRALGADDDDFYIPTPPRKRKFEGQADAVVTSTAPRPKNPVGRPRKNPEGSRPSLPRQSRQPVSELGIQAISNNGTRETAQDKAKRVEKLTATSKTSTVSPTDTTSATNQRDIRRPDGIVQAREAANRAAERPYQYLLFSEVEYADAAAGRPLGLPQSPSNYEMRNRPLYSQEFMLQMEHDAWLTEQRLDARDARNARDTELVAEPHSKRQKRGGLDLETWF